jgi:hypothetical protein
MAKKSAAPKNVLAPLHVTAVTKAVKKDEITRIQVENDYPTLYNEASARLKEAEEAMKDLKSIMQPSAIEEIYKINCERPFDTVASVKLVDEKGSELRVTSMNKYSAVAAADAESLFGIIRKKDKAVPDINTYLARVMVGKFDSKCFQGPDGKFDSVRFEMIKGSLDAVCSDLGIQNPLTTEEVVVPLPGFHAQRWFDFDVETNIRISQVVQNTVSFVPVKKEQE